MKSDHLQQWLHNVFNTEDNEISCSECFDSVSHYVDVELSGENAAAQMPQLRHHLNQCAACRQEYETLREFGRLENEGGLPSINDLQNLIP